MSSVARSFMPTAFSSARRGTEYRAAVTCSKCNTTVVGTDKPNCPPEVIAKHFTQQGWDIYRNGARATCPACKKGEKRRTTESEMSKETIIAQAKMFKMLEDHCASDGKTSRYDKEWDDDRVARESGLSPDAVREARETLRPGRLADPVVEGLETELAELRTRQERELGELRQLVENAAQEATRRYDELARRLQEARRRPR